MSRSRLPESVPESRTRSRSTLSTISEEQQSNINNENSNGYTGNSETRTTQRPKGRVFLPFPTNENKRKAMIEAESLARIAAKQEEFKKFQQELATARTNTRHFLQNVLTDESTNPHPVKINPNRVIQGGFRRKTRKTSQKKRKTRKHRSKKR